MRALIIDDSNCMRDIEKSILVQMNIEAFEAEDGVKALEMLENDSDFDLILLDINMPELNGLKTLEKIKASEKCNKIPVIMCTSSRSKLHVAKALQLGAVNYVIKPFQSDTFIRKIEQAMKL